MSDAPSSVDWDAIAASATARDDAPPDVPAAPEAIPEAPAPVVDTPSTEATTDLFDDPKVESFDRGYVEKLRKEAADRRTALRDSEERWKDWQEELDGLDDDQRGAARELVKAAKGGDALAMLTIAFGEEQAKSILAGMGEDAEPPPVAPPADVLTRADLERLLSERDAKAAQAEQVKAIESEAKALGYDPVAPQGTQERIDYVQLIEVARFRTDGDFAKAHEMIQSDRAAATQKIIADYIASKAPGSPAAASNGSVVPSDERPPPSSIDEALTRALEREGVPTRASQIG